MADPVRVLDGRFTYRDLANWPEDERWELIDGTAYSMRPAPNANHQRISANLLSALIGWLKTPPGPCEAFGAPFDVLLPSGADQPDDDVDTVVEPDVVVVCEPSRVTARFCRGAPDLVVEILSPWSGHRDQVRKLELYARHGVREYWVVDPPLPGFSIDLAELFARVA